MAFNKNKISLKCYSIFFKKKQLYCYCHFKKSSTFWLCERAWENRKCNRGPTDVSLFWSTFHQFSAYLWSSARNICFGEEKEGKILIWDQSLTFQNKPDPRWPHNQWFVRDRNLKWCRILQPQRPRICLHRLKGAWTKYNLPFYI